MHLKRKILLTLIILGFFLHRGYAQTASISGIINSYASIETILAWETNNVDSLVVNNLPIEFEDTDTVMVYVVRGSEIELDESEVGEGDFGRIGFPAYAGKYAFAIITEIIEGPVDTIVVLNASLSPEIYLLKPGDVAQLIKVPSFHRAMITGEVYAPPWNGETGGVVSMFVTTILTLNADINVSGLGFMGANAGSLDDPFEGDCSSTDIDLYDDLFYPMSPVLAGRKGEGITTTLFDSMRGKGRNINGGGGGNGKLSGGGGGSNFSFGGEGGDESGECTPGVVDPGGMGGEALSQGSGYWYLNYAESSGSYPDFQNRWNRIFFGGGGGAGVQVGGDTSSPGANGGGLVVIVADSIDGNNAGWIRADGGSVLNAVNGAGGGGGAGGGIILDVNGYKNNPRLSAVGGKGGDTNGATITGPGGGGGGGVYWFSGTGDQGLNMVTNVFGSRGEHLPTTNSYGASDGYLADWKDGLQAPLRGFLFNTVPTEFWVCSDQVPETIFASEPKGGSETYFYTWVDSSSTQNQWLEIPGATGQNLSFSSPLSDTTYYRRVVTDPKVANPDTSFRIAVYVHQAITDNTIAAPDTVCRGEAPEAFTSVGSPGNGNGDYSYLWQMAEINKPFVDAEGTNNQPGYDDAPTLDTTSIFRRIVTSGACVDTLALLTVDVFQPISGNLIADNDTICWNTMPALISQDPDIDLGGGDPDPTNWRYQWESAPAETGLWEDVPGATNPEYQPGILTATTWYRREVLSGNDDACRDMSLPVEILNVPLVTGNEIITDDQTVCTDDQPELMEGSAPGGGHIGLYSYQWESRTESSGWASADNTNGNDQQSYTPPVMSGDTTIYRRIVSSGGQEGVCKDTSITKTINVLPAIINNTISTSVTLNCQFDNLSDLLGSVPDGGATEGGVDPTRIYSWEKANGDNPVEWDVIADANEQNYSDMPVLSSAEDHWYRRVVLSGTNQECTSISDTIHVLIHTAITENLIDPADSACFNTEKVLLGELPLGEEGIDPLYSWRDAGNGSELGTEQTLPFTFTTLDDRQFNRIVAIGACEDTSNIMDITVMELPGGILSGDLPEACEVISQLDVELNVGSLTNYNTDWIISFSNGVDAELVDEQDLDARSSQHMVDVDLNNPDDVVSTQYNYTIGRISYELSDGTECVAPPENLSGNVPIEVFHTPSPEIRVLSITDEDSICGDIVELSVDTDKGTGFWSNDNSAKLRFEPNAQDLEVNASVDPSYADAWDQLPYHIYFTSTAGVCVGYDTVGIFFFEQPDDADAGPEDTVYFQNYLNLNANYPTAGIGTWTNGYGSGVFEDENDPKTLVTGLDKETTNQFRWTITNGNCNTSDDFTIITHEKAQPYEGFSPNGDQLNDYFIIRGLADAEWSISIFNSLGNSVRTITHDNVGEIDYDPNAILGGLRRDEQVVWDGKSNNGNMVPAGTYYYVMNAEITQENESIPDPPQQEKHYILVRY